MADYDMTAPLWAMNGVEKRLLRRKEPLISEVVQFTREVGRTAIRQGLLNEDELQIIMVRLWGLSDRPI